MPKPPKACAGSGQPPQHTYTRKIRSTGGTTRDVTAANCPANPEAHYDLPVHGGRVQAHRQ
ncbi:hypothetical protein L3Q65_00055 (plasmid) [Amycolatopsis sp. FU40]|uniref:hypothetical protein n=1 Tax=Amycolatopsis sp. FU40 TaxID=2914159 RepID=UPI001F406176|nr:hypothetical protein [Amycolatopsis sp. FU40]UKD50752.1 hypothetical protein L3Q65_00055 [Amycolatopsis sp. FU40]